MQYNILVVLEKAENNYSAYAPDVPGCVTTGKTVEETLTNMQEALTGHFEVSLEYGDPLPQISATEAHLVQVDVQPGSSKVEAIGMPTPVDPHTGSQIWLQTVPPISVELTSRELEVLSLMGKGYSNNKIAELLSVPMNTVRASLRAIYDKIGVQNRVEAIRRLQRADVQKLQRDEQAKDAG